MRGWTKLFLTLSIIGAINWGLVGFFNWNLIAAIFGYDTRADLSALSRITFAIIGLCGIGLAATLPRLEETRRPRRITPTIQQRTDVPV